MIYLGFGNLEKDYFNPRYEFGDLFQYICGEAFYHTYVEPYYPKTATYIYQPTSTYGGPTPTSTPYMSHCDLYSMNATHAIQETCLGRASVTNLSTTVYDMMMGTRNYSYTAVLELVEPFVNSICTNSSACVKTFNTTLNDFVSKVN